MFKTIKVAFVAASFLLPAFLSPQSTIAREPSAPAGTARMTVTVIGKSDKTPREPGKDDLQLTVGNERKQVGSWAKEDKLYLAILIDESLESNVASQWNDLRAFIMAQPASTSVAVAYARNSTAMVAQDFTDNHELAAKALRIPLGTISGGSSPYLAVADWLKRWPDNDARGSLILISSGIDFFRGGFGPIYPDVDTDISLAQKKNVNLWNIYSPSAGHRSHSFYLVNNAQLNLSKMTGEAGGESYYLGTSAPVTFKPYLDEIQRHLANQYVLSFSGDGGAKGKLVRARLKTEASDIEFMYANQAFLPPSR